MALATAYRQYQSTQTATAEPGTLVVMLFDGALRFLARAQRGMAAGDLAEQDRFIGKTQRILSELMASLDTKAGGAMAANLFSIYSYLYDRLTQANLKDDPAAIDEVREHLQTLRETWAEAEAACRAQGGIPAAAARERAQ